MAILRPNPVHRTNEFTWHPATKTFSAEASDLRWPIGRTFEHLGRVYDDACDEGFTLISERTGKPAVVAIDHFHSDDDFSEGWSYIEFIPVEPALRGKFRVVVYND